MKHLVVSVVFLTVAMSQTARSQGVAASQTPRQGATPLPQREHHRQVKKQIIPPANGQGANVAKAKPTAQATLSFSDAQQRHRHDRHDRAWWKQHYTTIVFVGGGYYYFDAGYWFPARGYDPLYDNYDYDGPIFTYGNLLPDQVIINVQRALQQLGYYSGGLTGSLGPSSRAALAAYQQDAGLAVTGAIDAPTVEALGLY